MIRVKNKQVIRTLSKRSLQVSQTRNLIATLAIALTALLFTSLFTIVGAVLHSFEQATFRQVGGDAHGSFKDISWEQVQELSSDPLIKKWGARLIVGMPREAPFNKTHVEVSYMDEQCAKTSFCMPTHGNLPKEGTNQMACDTRILKLLGIEPQIGAEITLSYEIFEDSNRTKIEDTFSLSGWWAYDEACPANMAIVPRSYAEEIKKQSTSPNLNLNKGPWDLYIYLDSTLHIRQDLITILEKYGYQNENEGEKDYVDIGVNWAYMGVQLSNQMDISAIIAIILVLILISLTGYLIIYNIFQISVTNDIRFYGLLKTVGTTGRQLRQIIMRQALYLSLWGIPIGLIIGWLVGNVLAPVLIANFNVGKAYMTAKPWIFILSSLFSLVTVLISCAKPGRMAGKVSPVEAVRYTEANSLKKVKRHGNFGGKMHHMALANLGRSKKRMVLVILSLALSVVLLEMTVVFARGFDMDKYLSTKVVSDFIIGNADYFQVGKSLFSSDLALSQEDINRIQSQGGITEGGLIYGKSFNAQTFVSEDWFRKNYSYNDSQTLDIIIADREHNDKGELSDDVQLYGMDTYPLNQLKVLEGDLRDLAYPEKKAIAAVYRTDDYDQPREETNWAKVGDQVTVRYVDKWKYIDTVTGKEIEDLALTNHHYVVLADSYREETYTVVACVTMKYSMSYRYHSSAEFIMGSEIFKQDSGTADIMTYLFDTTKEEKTSMDEFLKQYTSQIAPTLDYETKETYVKEFEGIRQLFLLMGGVLSFIVGLVGLLNFLNATLTSIVSRKREFAMLQSVGMTGKQLKKMLAWEGILYVGLASMVSLLLSVVIGPLLGQVMENILWFFTYHFVIFPVLIVMLLFILLGSTLPLGVYHFASRQTIVERLRQAES